MRALTAGGVTAALVLFGVPMAYAGTSGHAQRRPQTTTATPSLRWQLCPEDTDAWPDERCATVSVPQDYSNPNGPKISVLISRVDATTPAKRRGVLVVNPGGPGASGIGLAHEVFAHLSNADTRITDAYEIIGFDPRGVGHSASVSCGNVGALVKHPLPDHIPASPALERAQVDRARAVAAKCGATSKTLLPYISTANAVRDIDGIRAALGEQKINYLGYSYGSKLGAAYASLYPGRVDRMIIDSVMDPTEDGLHVGLDQASALDHRLDQFAAWTAKYDRTYHLGKTAKQVSTAIARLRARLGHNPADHIAGPSEFDDLALGSMYLDVQWPQLADMISQAVRGDLSSLVFAIKSLEEGNPLVNGNELAYDCVDSRWPRNWSAVHPAVARTAETAPAAWVSTWYSAPCVFWPVAPKAPVHIGGTKLPRILMFSAKDDPATPIAGARHMHRVLPGSRLVVEGGGNHAQYLENGNACIDEIGNAYLLTGKLPATDTTCKAVPPPTP